MRVNNNRLDHVELQVFRILEDAFEAAGMEIEWTEDVSGSWLVLFQLPVDDGSGNMEQFKTLASYAIGVIGLVIMGRTQDDICYLRDVPKGEADNMRMIVAFVRVTGQSTGACKVDTVSFRKEADAAAIRLQRQTPLIQVKPDQRNAPNPSYPLECDSAEKESQFVYIMQQIELAVHARIAERTCILVKSVGIHEYIRLLPSYVRDGNCLFEAFTRAAGVDQNEDIGKEISDLRIQTLGIWKTLMEAKDRKTMHAIARLWHNCTVAERMLQGASKELVADLDVTRDAYRASHENKGTEYPLYRVWRGELQQEFNRCIGSAHSYMGLFAACLCAVAVSSKDDIYNFNVVCPNGRAISLTNTCRYLCDDDLGWRSQNPRHHTIALVPAGGAFRYSRANVPDHWIGCESIEAHRENPLHEPPDAERKDADIFTAWTDGRDVMYSCMAADVAATVAALKRDVADGKFNNLNTPDEMARAIDTAWALVDYSSVFDGARAMVSVSILPATTSCSLPMFMRWEDGSPMNLTRYSPRSETLEPPRAADVLPLVWYRGFCDKKPFGAMYPAPDPDPAKVAYIARLVQSTTDRLAGMHIQVTPADAFTAKAVVVMCGEDAPPSHVMSICSRLARWGIRDVIVTTPRTKVAIGREPLPDHMEGMQLHFVCVDYDCRDTDDLVNQMREVARGYQYPELEATCMSFGAPNADAWIGTAMHSAGFWVRNAWTGSAIVALHVRSAADIKTQVAAAERFCRNTGMRTFRSMCVCVDTWVFTAGVVGGMLITNTYGQRTDNYDGKERDDKELEDATSNIVRYSFFQAGGAWSHAWLTSNGWNDTLGVVDKGHLKDATTTFLKRVHGMGLVRLCTTDDPRYPLDSLQLHTRRGGPYIDVAAQPVPKYAHRGLH